VTTPTDDAVLPPGVTAADFAAALRAFTEALGDGAVLRSAEAAGEFRDPYAFASWDEHWPSAVLMPGSVDEVREVVRIAARYRVPLWTNSMGKNNAYGGGAPRARGSVVVSLRRMNRILEINEELAYAVVEPGVSFFDLCAELRRRGSALWASIPDLGWGSVIGNTLDHGFGYLPEGDHAVNQYFAPTCASSTRPTTTRSSATTPTTCSSPSATGPPCAAGTRSSRSTGPSTSTSRRRSTSGSWSWTTGTWRSNSPPSSARSRPSTGSPAAR
jgi:hypothetical protein